MKNGQFPTHLIGAFCFFLLCSVRSYLVSIILISDSAVDVRGRMLNVWGILHQPASLLIARDALVASWLDMRIRL